MKQLAFIIIATAVLASSLAWGDSKDKDHKTFQSADGKYQLDLPKGWESMDFHVDTVQIGAINKHNGEYVEVIVENISDYTDSLGQYAEAKRNTMVMSLDNPKLTPAEEADMHGLAAVRYEIHGQLPSSGTPIAYILTVAKTKTHYIQIITWTKESHFKDDQADMENLAGGFSEPGAEPASEPSDQK